MRYKIIIIIILIFIPVLNMHPGYGEQGPVKIAFFSQRSQGDMFWGQFIEFMNEAVNDLGMELNVYYANSNHIRMIEQVRESIKNYRPSVLLFQNFKKHGASIIKIAEEEQIPCFIVNAGFQENEGMGKPREFYRYWIGEITPDDEHAGYILADLLIKTALPGTNGNIHMAAISGNIADDASIERVKGLERAVKDRDDVVLEQIFSSDWSSVVAEQKFLLFKRGRYPETGVVWAACDAVALGVIKGAKKMNLIPGDDIITGGIDWSIEGLDGVMSGEMIGTIGGHFMEGAWAAVLIFDYFYGYDFASETVQFRSKMAAITSSNVNAYLEILSRDNWAKIDFRKFSKTYNPSLKYYNFSIWKIFNEIK